MWIGSRASHASRPAPSPRLALAALLFAAGCAGTSDSGKPAERVVNLQTMEGAEVEEGDAKARVRVTANDTILDLCGMEFTCRNWRGWLGRLGARRGSVQVGALRFVYEDAGVRIFAKKGVWQVPHEAGRRSYVEQSGEFGPNVFK